MPISRIGKSREATQFTSEKYKSAIRDYMEAMGYAQTTDSSIEGHPADMIFLPQANSPWPEAWVEAKATKLSLSNKEFAEEVRAYLKQWLSRTPQTRFKFMIFASQLINLSRWENIWGNALSPEQVISWLTEDLDGSSASLLTEGASLKDVISFFSEASVVEGTDLDLVDAADERERPSSLPNVDEGRTGNVRHSGCGGKLRPSQSNPSSGVEPSGT